MCGVVGILATEPVNQALFDALTMIQHRGQDAAGIVTSDGSRLFLCKGNGLVRDVIRTWNMVELKGNIGIGHVRYPTAGTSNAEESQPFYVNSPYGIVLTHNGNLTNTEQLKKTILRSDLRHLNTHSDSEVLLNIFAHELAVLNKINLAVDDIFDAVSAVHQRCRGAYAVVSLIMGYGIVAFRDPHGIRPLVYGKRSTERGTEYMVASESVALDCLGFELCGDVLPGEAVFIGMDGRFERRQCAKNTQYSPCIFEYVYLARPDSVMDKISVYKTRLRLGQFLADKITRSHSIQDIDVVMPIPDTSRTAAYTLALKLGLTYREGFVKNRYVGRTFIMPGQGVRKKSVRQKLNTIQMEFKNKNVLLVDDSIVRGNTSKEIVALARQAGAKNVYFASSAPPVRYPNVYGIDIPVAEELIAHDRSEQDVAEIIGADWLVYLDLVDLIAAAHEGNNAITRFEDSVFSGHYLTGDIDKKYLAQIARMRKDEARQAVMDGSNHLDLFNRT